MSNYYDREGQPLALLEWAEKMEDPNYARIRKDEFPGDIVVSTVWLGIDHGFGGEGPPVIFETMIFGGEHTDEQWRYYTEKQAVTGHAAAVALVMGAEVSS